ncbi:hypothetical protein [Micromonospora echinofusca]|uniref:hypothetical protein n=1 Tax=Micromonospora echinofusca TaxID=47858 RepID=UPI0012FD220C|nr:hypothetical protein [Micromonospora echinofusca]
MRANVLVVHPGTPIMVDVVVAGVPVRAEWVGVPPSAGELVDVELDVDAILGWADAIAVDGAEAILRDGPRLRGSVELQDQELLTVRVAEGLVQVQVDDGSRDVPPGTTVVVVVEQLRLYPTGV